MRRVAKMKVESTLIEIDNLRFHAYHGVMKQEQSVGNDYVLSLKIHCDVTSAMMSDCVDDTVNYAEAAAIAEREIKQPSQLIERVAYRIAEKELAAFPRISSITVRLTKIAPPIAMDCDGATVEITCKR